MSKVAKKDGSWIMSNQSAPGHQGGLRRIDEKREEAMDRKCEISDEYC